MVSLCQANSNYLKELVVVMWGSVTELKPLPHHKEFTSAIAQCTDFLHLQNNLILYSMPLSYEHVTQMVITKGIDKSLPKQLRSDVCKSDMIRSLSPLILICIVKKMIF
jgi:hypothetical protein